jgi:hypothetical protein
LANNLKSFLIYKFVLVKQLGLHIKYLSMQNARPITLIIRANMRCEIRASGFFKKEYSISEFFGVAKYIARNDFWSYEEKMSLENVQGEQLASIEDVSSRQWHHYKIFVGGSCLLIFKMFPGGNGTNLAL